jgi:hypothetical protein
MLPTSELRALLDELSYRERLMDTICATIGLPICEVLGLKWELRRQAKPSATMKVYAYARMDKKWNAGRVVDHYWIVPGRTEIIRATVTRQTRFVPTRLPEKAEVFPEITCN